MLEPYRWWWCVLCFYLFYVSGMAKTGAFEEVHPDGAMEKAKELKRELLRLVKTIVVDEDEECGVEIIDKAREVMCALKDLKLKNNRKRCSSSVTLMRGKQEQNCSFLSCLPDVFKCPLSKELMRDPVIVSTGQTYDRPFIQKWLKAGNRTCPRSQQVLSNTTLTPNLIVQDMIVQWCRNNGVEMSEAVHCVDDEDRVTEADKNHFLSLLKKMASTLPNQKEGAKELRLLTKKMPSFRALFGQLHDAIPQLVNPLISLSKSVDIGSVQPDLQEDVITTLLNLSIHDSNKKLVAETPMVITLLTDAMRSGTIQTRSNAAAALFTLSALDSNKLLIGKSGALQPLISLLEEGHPSAMRDVTSAIFNLCIMHDNKARAIREGAVRVIVEKIRAGMYVDELLAILAMLSSHPKAVVEMCELGAVQCLLTLTRSSSCNRNKENCIAILYSICFSDRTKWKGMREEENTCGTISKLAQNGTSRAKRKATGILDRLNKLDNFTHTA